MKKVMFLGVPKGVKMTKLTSVSGWNELKMLGSGE